MHESGRVQFLNRLQHRLEGVDDEVSVSSGVPSMRLCGGFCSEGGNCPRVKLHGEEAVIFSALGLLAE